MRTVTAWATIGSGAPARYLMVSSVKPSFRKRTFKLSIALATLHVLNRRNGSIGEFEKGTRLLADGSGFDFDHFRSHLLAWLHLAAAADHDKFSFLHSIERLDFLRRFDAKLDLPFFHRAIGTN